tara:strand:+ start:28334 stop:29710 length:1377 start_codon:yes stop_codon:yes gene_type:complete
MVLKAIFTKKVNILAISCLIAIVAISLMKSAMELEDAEQAYFSQWLRLGYDDQPPLFTWLQYIVNAILGITVISFSLLRGLIFSSILVTLYKFSSSYLKDISKSNLVVFSLALIPVFIDFTFRRLSHTSLLCLVILISYLILQKLVEKKSIGNYIALGSVVGLGILTKYNYVMVLASLALMLFVDKGIRSIIFNKYILLSITITVLIITPHFYWLFSNHEFLRELQSSVELKTSIVNENFIPILSPFLAMLKNILKIVAPLAIVLVVFKSIKKIQLSFNSKDWLTKMLFAQLIVILLFFVFIGVQKTEERWFLPLLIPFLPLLLKSVQIFNIKKWESYGFVIFIVLIGIQVVRTPIEKVLNISSDVHFGFQPVSEVLNTKFKDENWILPNVTYGGNIKLLNTSKEVFSSDDFSLPMGKIENKESVIVVIGKENITTGKVLDSVIDFGRHKENVYFLKN